MTKHIYINKDVTRMWVKDNMMNEVAVVRYLATEIMGWEELVEIDNDYLWHIKWAVDDNMPRTVRDFDPIHNISHAFMVEDAIVKMGISKQNKYAVAIAYQTAEDFTFDFDYMMDVIHASPKQRSIAAVRATATEQQIAELVEDRL